MTEFKPLSLSTLAPGTGYARPYFSTPNLVRVGSSALEVMTDLRYVATETIGADVTLEAATQKMIVRGVRSLLVVNGHEDVIGIITARDLMGQRALQASAAQNIECGAVKVHDAMTTADCIEVMRLEDVLHAHVGDIVVTLKHSGRQHALVVEIDPMLDKAVIRGVFSASQIARQLGISPAQGDLQRTFAQIESAMRG